MGKDESKKLDLPEVVTLADHDGDFKKYYDSVYDIFLSDIRNSQPTYLGKKVVLRLKEETKEGKDWNFHKLAHGGEEGSENSVDLLRLERIIWIKHILEQCPCDQIKVLPEIRKVKRVKKNGKKVSYKDKRLVIIYEYDRYVIVLADRKKYWVLWTAFQGSQRWFNNLMQKYEAYKKTETAQT